MEPIAARSSGSFQSSNILQRQTRCTLQGVPLSKRFVYILKSDHLPARYYTGLTSDVRARVVSHNEGRCRHTISGRPWQVDVVIEFADERRAIAFEKYLKSGSGNAFANRHFRLGRSS